MICGRAVPDDGLIERGQEDADHDREQDAQCGSVGGAETGATSLKAVDSLGLAGRHETTSEALGVG